jgi:hypothetical protein
VRKPQTRDSHEITVLLHRLQAGDRTALDALIPMVYSELKKLAAGHLRNEAKAPAIDTTARVHEAFLRLAGPGTCPTRTDRTLRGSHPG